MNRRHSPSSWTFACWYAFARLDEPAGEWPNPQAAAMSRAAQSQRTPAEALDTKEGNTYKARGTAVEAAFAGAIRHHAPRSPTIVAQPAADTAVPNVSEDRRADFEVRWPGSTRDGDVFDVTAINTRSVGRVKNYKITLGAEHPRGSQQGPSGALAQAVTKKVADYIRLYKHSEFHAYAVDLVGTPSSSSRKALVALCKKAYSGSVYDGDSLYPLRMTNAIVKEVAIATAKATALAIFRNPRPVNDASPPPQAATE